jgi:uncharacterized delta-60 repeat protein
MKNLLFLRTRQQWVRFAIIAFAVCLSISVVRDRVQAAPGDLDPSFGSGGKVVTDFGADDGIMSLLVQPDGKIVAVGFVSSRSGFAVARYNSNGSLDSSWGTNGLVTTEFFGGGDTALGSFLQTDGEIIVAGRVQEPLGRYVFGLVRYDRSGNLDPAFGVNGKVSTELFDDERALGVAFQSDGKTVVMGGASLNAKVGIGLARYNPDGGLDVNFGTGGTTLLDLETWPISPSAVTVKPDNKVVLAGFSLGGSTGFALIGLNENGSVDQAFGLNGLVITDFGGRLAIARDLASGADGKIVAAGIFQDASGQTQHSALARYNSDGSLDTAFGTDGKLVSAIHPFWETLFSLSLQPDGKIITCGLTINSFAFVARYNSSGSFDSRFAGAGFITTQFSDGWNSYARSVAIQPDGKILAGGGTFPPNSAASDFGLLRLEGASFDLCIQDESNGSVLQLNTTSGAYQFSNCSGVTLSGTGRLMIRGGIITLQHYDSDRRVLANIDRSSRRAVASVQLLTLGRTYLLTDRNITDSVCLCQKS